MTEERTPYTHGGKRPGSGRKPKGKTGAGIMISVRLTPWIARWLRSQPRGKRTELIEEALIRAYDIEKEV